MFTLNLDYFRTLVLFRLQISPLNPLLELIGRCLKVVLLEKLNLSVVEIFDSSSHQLKITVDATVHKVHHTNCSMC